MDGLSLNAWIIGITTQGETRTNPSHITTSRTSEKSNSSPLPKTWPWSFAVRYPLTSFFSADCNRYDAVIVSEDEKEESARNRKNGNWVLRVLQVRSFWNTDGYEQVNNHVQNDNEVSIDEDYYDACRVDDDVDDKLKFDRASFSKMLWSVSLVEARLYAQMAYLGSLSYTIPKIKLGNLLKRHRLRYVTSSLEKKAELASKSKKEKASEEVRQGEYINLETDAKDQVKQSVVDDLNLLCSSPCEWFICDDDDDDEGSTRYFVIQGSESIASWQANILFEPVQFEAHDVIVHRGIYEAAKVVYEQLLPHVHQHFERHGKRATIRLTGHSLGGSLSLLVNLMLLIRDQVPRSCLLPVITFGAPWVMCGGDRLLQKLGLPRNHLQGITMHRDIVPRAFSCNYPSQLADILKAINGNFRNHPCLSNQNLLYAPMGEFLILQPDAKVSPSHELLPAGCGLYVLRCEGAGDANKQTMAAQSVFLNTPHPLDILRDRCAYGSEGGIQRDHDVETYLISIRSVIRQELNRVKRSKRRGHVWWQLVGVNQSEVQLLFYGGKEYLKWLRVVVASNHMYLICFVRWLIMEACSWITPR
ncbi:phospholipase A1 PLIP2, chloroplastic [Lactuca sativa]|uniref:Fungal lipase-type domain-containing protein n=1 Tax=Lactuca sativa TaxID=4236 RepID=A0A9R1UK30_LACSA|nr:phospholipase A1 PLIP2, chloroplastic [Lactuca sativa]KAJ0188430.1 hypothetical protein LSAT_V11C900455470 [Lactuca sativa]